MTCAGCCSPTLPLCCLYPWPNPIGLTGPQLYPSSDLPSAININGASYARNPTYAYGYAYGNPGTSTPFVFATDGEGDQVQWIWGDGFGSGDASACLIGTYALGAATITDQFSNSYSVTATFAPLGGSTTLTVTRVDPCTWYGEGGLFLPDLGDEQRQTVRIQYEAYQWKIDAYGFNLHDGHDTATKASPQSSPAGNYATTGPYMDVTGADFTVS